MNFGPILKMPDAKEIVINTGPIIALVAAMGDLRVLQMYEHVWVPYEVHQEIMAGGRGWFAVAEFQEATWLKKQPEPLEISSLLLNTLDRGEAAVIQLALNKDVRTVCIDETAGRRVARLHGLLVTGSIGVLLRAKREGYPFSMRTAIDRMISQGVWLSEQVISFALTESGEN